MPRVSKKRKSKNEITSSILESLQFVSMVQGKEGEPSHTHCQIVLGSLIASSPLMSIYTKIDIDLNCFPHTASLISALKQCGKELAITNLDNGKLQLKSGKLLTKINCIPVEEMKNSLEADDPICDINNDLKESFEKLIKIPYSNGINIMDNTILMKSESCVASNDKHLIVEHWHGIDLPEIAVPIEAVKVILKSDKNLSKLGFSDSTVTFHFDDGSYLVSKLYEGKWPVKYIEEIFNIETTPFPIVDGFFDAIEKITEITQAEKVSFQEDGIYSNNKSECLYALKGLPEISYNPNLLLLVKDLATEVDWGSGKFAIFFGENCRMILSHLGNPNG